MVTVSLAMTSALATLAGRRRALGPHDPVEVWVARRGRRGGADIGRTGRSRGGGQVVNRPELPSDATLTAWTTGSVPSKRSQNKTGGAVGADGDREVAGIPAGRPVDRPVVTARRCRRRRSKPTG